MELYKVDDTGRLYISPAITSWDVLEAHGIDTIIDLEGDLDMGVPTIPDRYLYVYFPIHDADLPNLRKLHAVARLGADLVAQGHTVLSHCGMGFNRSALVAGLVLHELGLSGPSVIEQLRRCRPGALFNDVFAAYVASLPAPGARRQRGQG
jgi:protein-tyrosine phosphatase